jgi:hypothetical protein
VIIGAATLIGRFMLPLMSRLPGLITLVMPLSFLVLIGSIGGLLLARRATRRIADTGYTRGLLTLATLGTWIGWANVALSFAGFFLWPVGTILDNVPR